MRRSVLEVGLRTVMRDGVRFLEVSCSTPQMTNLVIELLASNFPLVPGELLRPLATPSTGSSQGGSTQGLNNMRDSDAEELDRERGAIHDGEESKESVHASSSLTGPDRSTPILVSSFRYSGRGYSRLSSERQYSVEVPSGDQRR